MRPFHADQKNQQRPAHKGPGAAGFVRAVSASALLLCL